MNKQPARLGKCNADEVLEEQLTISGKELVIIFILVIIFGILCFLAVPKTYGWF